MRRHGDDSARRFARTAPCGRSLRLDKLAAIERFPRHAHQSRIAEIEHELVRAADIATDVELLNLLGLGAEHARLRRHGGHVDVKFAERAYVSRDRQVVHQRGRSVQELP